jgi:Uma2 family endonuclease
VLPSAIVPVTATIDPAISVDQRVTLRNVGWSEYEALLAMRDESAVPRISYLEGMLELMSPSQDHEILKKKLARLVEAYADELGLELEGYGSWTLKRSELERGAEPGECYSIGPAKDVPALAIEVVWTSGGLNKLEIYRLLGVREVWVWEQGDIRVVALRGDRYEKVARSESLPQIDLDLVRSLLDAPSQTAAVRELRARLRSRG